jgi:hypothetical protein
MKKLSVLAVAVLLVLAASSVFAQPSSKAGVAVTSLTLIDATTETHSFDPVLTTTIKTPNQKDLLIGVSLETALYTLTQVKSKHGQRDSSNATAGIDIKVVIDEGTPDEQMAKPGVVTFDERSQTLSAELGGVIESCTLSVDPDTGDGTLDIKEDCLVTDEMIELILQTMSAHHFNFIVANLTPGVHTVTVKAEINSSTDSTNGTADAWANIGQGTLSIEEIRATNAPEGVIILE